MISYLVGELAEVLESSVIIDVGGVGYEVFVPATFLATIPESSGSIKLYTHQSFREDGQTLHGFLTRKERDLFRLLLTVSGIGPKVGLAVLSNLLPDKVVDAVIREDAVLLSSVPGVGKKTASRIVLELREKVGFIAYDSAVPYPQATVNAPQSLRNDVVDALSALGFNPREVQRTFNSLTPEETDNLRTEEDYIKYILKKMK